MAKRRKRATASRRSETTRRVRGGIVGRGIRKIWLAFPSLILLGFGLAEMAPYVDKITKQNSPSTDWWSYKKNAIEIVRHGLFFSTRHHVYARPAGFLYSYFVALFLALGRMNDTVVIFAQLVLVGVAASVMYVTFGDQVGRWFGMLYFVLVTALFVWEREFFETLLSETLLIILLPWVFFFLRRGYEMRSRVNVAIAGFLAGLCMLTRPNAGLMIPALAIVLFVYIRDEKPRWALPLLFCVAAAAAQIPLIVRNIAVMHSVELGTFSPVLARTSDWIKVHHVPLRETLTSPRTGSVLSYFTRLEIVFGYVAVVDQWVVHWTAMWIGVIVYVVTMIRMKRDPGFAEAMLIAFIASYILPLVLFTSLTSYSGRMLIPGLAAVLFLGVLGVERLMEMLRVRRVVAA